LKKALIAGITGQDGSYLTDLLLEKGYEVHGIVRRSSSFNRWRIEHLIQDPEIYGKKLFLHYADLSDDASLRRIFSKTKPDEFYHLAGQSHVGISFEIPEVTTQEIANCTLKLLEICRDQTTRPRSIWPVPLRFLGILRTLPRMKILPSIPLLPTGLQKPSACTPVIFIGSLINLFVCNGILYNHESPRRGENFVTQKIVHGAAAIAKVN
jgi:GDPmannose 4,6-dehydratase